MQVTLVWHLQVPREHGETMRVWPPGTPRAGRPGEASKEVRSLEGGLAPAREWRLEFELRA